MPGNIILDAVGNIQKGINHNSPLSIGNCWNIQISVPYPICGIGHVSGLAFNPGRDKERKRCGNNERQNYGYYNRFSGYSDSIYQSFGHAFGCISYPSIYEP